MNIFQFEVRHRIYRTLHMMICPTVASLPHTYILVSALLPSSHPAPHQPWPILSLFSNLHAFFERFILAGSFAESIYQILCL